MRTLSLLLFFVISLKADMVSYYQQKAYELQLDQKPYWSLLLHMNDGVSEIDDPNFFFSNIGKRDAASELNATIEALFDTDRLDDESPGCRYPARKTWIGEQLGITEWPQVQCDKYNTLLKRMDPRSASMVFSSAHINSPASMFGHTFLRIDSSMESKLLSYAVNYAARTGDDGGFLFAAKGLFGGYPGFYSLLPYYEKLKEYSDTEQRDVWEYDLNLTEAEVMRMVRHIWELENIYTWYYFFDENCSYNLLWLIEIARPGVKLREEFFYYVNPPETIFVLQDAGLVRAKHYRPSKRTKLLAYEQHMSKQMHKDVMELSRGELAPESLMQKEYSLVSKQRILEAASEMTEYRYIAKDMNHSEYTGQFHDILTARSKLGRGEKVVPKQPPNPDRGHLTNRLSLYTGWREERPIQVIGFRPAYHDLTDSDVGFLRGTQIEFLNVQAHYSDKQVKLEKATLLSISSIAPVSAFFSPFSWRMYAGAHRNFRDEKLHPVLSVGAGYSVEIPSGDVYAMIDPMLMFYDGVTGGLGLGGGAVLYAKQRLKVLLEVQQRYFTKGEPQIDVRAVVGLRTSRNTALKLHYGYNEKEFGQWRNLAIGFDYFF